MQQAGRPARRGTQAARRRARRAQAEDRSPSSTSRPASAAPCASRPARWTPSSARPSRCTPSSPRNAPAANCACRPARSTASPWCRSPKTCRTWKWKYPVCRMHRSLERAHDAARRLLHTSHGGVHPAEHKERIEPHAPIARRAAAADSWSCRCASTSATRPSRWSSVGEQVLKGQMIGAGRRLYFGGGPRPQLGHRHAPSTCSRCRILSGLPDLCIIIETDGEDAGSSTQPLDYQRLDTGRTAQAAARPGIVGLGGAVFPSHVKLNPGAAQPARR